MSAIPSDLARLLANERIAGMHMDAERHRLAREAQRARRPRAAPRLPAARWIRSWIRVVTRFPSFLVVITVIVALAILAPRYGADSRGLGDHQWQEPWK